MPAERWRKKPVVIEACRWDGSAEAAATIGRWGDECGRGVSGQPEDPSIFIRTLEGVMEARDGDYVIRGVRGEIYPCKPDVFRATYERCTSEGDKRHE